MLEWASQFDHGNPYVWESFLSFFCFLTGYFLSFRGFFRPLFIKEVHRTKKERKKHEDVFWNESGKARAKRFLNWLLCRSYTKEQKRRGYIFFVFLNYFYLIVGFALFLLWICSLCIPQLKVIFIAFSALKLIYLDGPILAVNTLKGLIGAREYRRRHKWDMQ